VHGQLEQLALVPRIPETWPRALVEAPAGQARLQRALVLPEDADLDVLVRSRDFVEEEIDRPAAGDEP
jgi:hypothetical protein